MFIDNPILKSKKQSEIANWEFLFTLMLIRCMMDCNVEMHSGCFFFLLPIFSFVRRPHQLTFITKRQLDLLYIRPSFIFIWDWLDYKMHIWCAYVKLDNIDWIKLNWPSFLHAQSSTANNSLLITQIWCERNDIIFLSLVIRLAYFAPIYYYMMIIIIIIAQFHVNRKTF